MFNLYVSSSQAAGGVDVTAAATVAVVKTGSELAGDRKSSVVLCVGLGSSIPSGLGV